MFTFNLSYILKMPDINNITEPWLSTSFTNNIIIPSVYQIYRRDRWSNGGGVLIALLIAVSNRLHSFLISSSTIEFIAINIMS